MAAFEDQQVRRSADGQGTQVRVQAPATVVAAAVSLAMGRWPSLTAAAMALTIWL